MRRGVSINDHMIYAGLNVELDSVQFDERLPVVGQQQERLREPGGRCLTAGNGPTWSGRLYAGPSWTSEPAPWPVQVDTRGFLSMKFSREHT